MPRPIPHRMILLGAAVLAAAAAATVLAWQSRAHGREAPIPASPRAIVVRGHIEPASRVLELQSPTGTGVIRELRVQEGQAVRRGDVIAVLEGYEAQKAAVHVAERTLEYSKLARDQALASAKESDILAQRQAVEGRRAQLLRAQQEHRRQASLFGQQMVSAQALEQAAAELRQAEAAVAQAEHGLQGLREVRGVDRAAAAARVAVDAAALEKARADLDQLLVRAPIDATVLSIMRRAGEAVGGAGVVRIASLKELIVIAQLDESHVMQIDRDKPAVVEAGFLAAPVSATVKYINPEIYRQSRPHSDTLLGRDARVVEVELAPSKPLPAVFGAEVQVRFSPRPE